jgi:hypothetical protein
LSESAWHEVWAGGDRREARRVQRRIAVRTRAAARFVALPALAAMGIALVLFWRQTQPFPVGAGATAWTVASTPTVAFSQFLRSDNLWAPNWWMSVGLLALMLLPAINVMLVLWENLRRRRWPDATAALGVLALLAVGALIARR